MDVSEIFDIIYIWVSLVNSKSALLLTFGQYMLYSHFTQNCNFYFFYFLEVKNPCFVTRNCSKSSYICLFILSKKQLNWFYKNLYNSAERCRTSRWIEFLMLYQLLYNIRSPFNELILAWSAKFYTLNTKERPTTWILLKSVLIPKLLNNPVVFFSL